MIRTQLETARLKLRLFTHDDVQIMFELCSDPEVIKYADTPAKDLQEARQRLQQGPLTDYEKIRIWPFCGRTKRNRRGDWFLRYQIYTGNRFA